MNVVLFAVLLCLGVAHSKSIKNELLSKLDEQQHKAEEGIAHFEEAGFNYFAALLNQTIARISFIRGNVQRLPDNATESVAGLMIEEVKYIQVQVKYKIENPAPYEIIKASGLYIASMVRIQNNLTLSKQLKKQIVDIIKQEIYISTLNGVSSFDRIGQQAANQQLKGLYQVLLDTMRSFNVPTYEDDMKLIEETRKIIQELEEHHKEEQAIKIKVKLVVFEFLTKQLAQLLPIGDEARADLFEKVADSHYRQSLELVILK